MNQAEATARVMATAKRLFFVGIGGISMSSLAMVCHTERYAVAGSDRAVSTMTERLEASGIPVTHIHRAENITGFDAVVYTGAVTMENPELAAATATGLPTIYRADLLGYLMRQYTHRIGVAGMHGKSTTTSMLAHLFLAAGRDPTVLSGAETTEMEGAYRLGGKSTFIFEACEYKDSFLCFFPSISVILDIDLDHTDYFTGGIKQIKDSFRRYASLPFTKDAVLPLAVVNADDDNVIEATKGLPAVITFGLKNKADYMAKNVTEERGCARFDLYHGETFLCHIALSVFGFHHIYNALASAAVGDSLGIPAATIGEALSSFAGVKRRFEYCGDINGAGVYLDYAHHPRELQATLDGARRMTAGRLLCYFEPHTYSRTAALFDDFAAAFDIADEVQFLPIYAARETNHFGVSSEQLANKAKNGLFCPSYEEAVCRIRRAAAPGDTVMILGAGTVDCIAKSLMPNKTVNNLHK